MSELTKRQLAQKRNYFKFVLTGMFRKIDENVLTQYEIDLWGQILENRQKLLENFDNNSISQGLRVPDKCWCGKEGKYEYRDEFYTGKVCKKHLHE